MKQAVRLLFYIAVLIFLVSIDKKLESMLKLQIAQVEYLLQFGGEPASNDRLAQRR